MIKRYILFAMIMAMTGFLCRIICEDLLTDKDNLNQNLSLREILAYLLLIFAAIFASFFIIGEITAGLVGALAASYFSIKRKNFFDVAAVSSAAVIIAEEIMHYLSLE